MRCYAKHCLSNINDHFQCILGQSPFKSINRELVRHLKGFPDRLSCLENRTTGKFNLFYTRDDLKRTLNFPIDCTRAGTKGQSRSSAQLKPIQPFEFVYLSIRWTDGWMDLNFQVCVHEQGLGFHHFQQYSRITRRCDYSSEE